MVILDIGKILFEKILEFDIDKKKIGKRCGEVIIKDIKNISDIGSNGSIKIGIIAVPPDSAQDVANTLIKAGVRSILNFAPVVLKVNNGVTVRNIDLSNELENFSFILSSQET